MRKAILTAAGLILATAAFGQSTPSLPAFDIVSIKPTPRGQVLLRRDFCLPGGRFAVSGPPAKWSLKYAFGLQDYQIAGAPPWLDDFDSAYDIEAQPSEPVNEEQCRLMVQSLFADRFKLAAHREKRELPVYLLVVGKKGAKLHEGGGVKLNGGVEVEASGKRAYPDGWTMSRFAAYLSDWAGRPVIDRTGFAGNYGITLTYSRSADDGRPSIFTAVQEQLGLKLNTGKAPIEMFVIDHIEKPSAN